MAKIICVEDEPDIREDLVETLELAGHTVFQAENGAEGLAMILGEQPDLTISDIFMPEMSGYDLLIQIRESHPQFADMPFVFLTAKVDRADQIMGRNLGADEYLIKPVDFGLMLSSINSRLRQVQRMRQQQKQMLLSLFQAATGSCAPAHLQDENIDFDSMYALLNAQGSSVRQLLSLIGRGMAP